MVTPVGIRVNTLVPPSGPILKHFLLLAWREKGVSMEKVKFLWK
jgi:hypothetical protein